MENDKGIFVSYRRDETTAYAGWLAGRLGDHFGQQNVFRDIGFIEPGTDFVAAIERALQSCAVMLVVIGRSWATKLAEHEQTGQEDYTRLEVTTALKRDDVRVIPVLVQGASMPRANELPAELAALTRRNAIELHDTNWESDVEHLLDILEKVSGISKASTGTMRIKRDQLSPQYANSALRVLVDGDEIRQLEPGQHADLQLKKGAHHIEVYGPTSERISFDRRPFWQNALYSAPSAVVPYFGVRNQLRRLAQEQRAAIAVEVHSGKVLELFCGFRQQDDRIFIKQL